MLGQLLKQRYQIIKVLKTEGFCQTYVAIDISQPNYPECIVKQILPTTKERANNLQENAKKSLIREREALKLLNSCSRVPRLLAYFKEEQKVYLVQELIEGHSLAKEIYPGVCGSESWVIQLVCEVLEILVIVHSYGLIHQNIKPSNLIRVKSTQKLALIDFGAAKQAWSQAVKNKEITCINSAQGIDGTICLGTPGYMPIEQEEGKPGFNSDIYALGMMAIQALTGLSPTQLPEDAQTGEILWQQHVRVSREFAKVLSLMVSYHSKDRYQSATETLQAFQPLITRTTPTAPEEVYLPRSVTDKSSSGVASNLKIKTKPSLSVAVSAIASILTVIAGGYYWLQSPSFSLRAENPLVSIGTNIALVHTLKSHKDVVWGAISSFDGQTLISSSGDKTIKLWDLSTGKLLQTLRGNSEQVLSLAISQGDRTLVSGGYNPSQAISIWNLPTGIRQTLEGDSNYVWSVAISPDDQLLASSNGDGSINVWTMLDGRLRYRLFGHLSTVWSVAISPNSQMLVSASSDKTINLWDLRSRELVHIFTGHSDRVRTVAFSPDGQIIASGSWDKSIKIWNIQTKTLQNTLSGHSGIVNSVAISPDSQILASGSDDNTIKLWNLSTGKLLHTLKQHSGNINSVSFSPDGNTLISSSGDRTIKVWRLKS